MYVTYHGAVGETVKSPSEFFKSADGNYNSDINLDDSDDNTSQPVADLNSALLEDTVGDGEQSTSNQENEDVLGSDQESVTVS